MRDLLDFIIDEVLVQVGKDSAKLQCLEWSTATYQFAKQVFESQDLNLK